MITRIEISGIGVIDRAELDFGEGLTVLTGETGAGKTMVLTSVDLLLGGRADPGLVRTGHENAQVDGFFTVDPSQAQIAQDEGGLVEDGELIVSRTVPAQGRSRARLGGRPVPASSLTRAIAPLITVHGQADQIRLTSPNAQRALLDSSGDARHRALMAEYAEHWRAAVALKKELDEALADSSTRGAQIDELSKALELIDALDVHEGEDEELRIEARRLMSVEDLGRLIEAARTAIQGADEEPGAARLLRESLDRLDDAKRMDEALEETAARLRSIVIDAQTLADDLADYARTLDADPARLSQVMSRRHALKNLLEGRASDATGLLEWADEARERLARLVDPDKDPEKIRERLTDAQAQVIAAGERLTASRKRLATRLAEAVGGELQALAMKDAALEILVAPSKPNSHGLDEVTILLRPHPSANARPLGQGASGGELSRIMLALEVVLGEGDEATTFIFDEVDAGIGGRTATEVGARLAALAKKRQVLVVTHLPQVAVFASTHLVVSKQEGTTRVVKVEGAEREAELTRMMGGDPHSPAARRHAIEVLTSAVPQSKG